MSSPAGSATLDEDSIRAVVARLARPDGGGGHVIERAAILAAGADSAAIERWILDHAGRPEAAPGAHVSGLHGGRLTSAAGPGRAPRRFLLPPGALSPEPSGSSPNPLDTEGSS